MPCSHLARLGPKLPTAHHPLVGRSKFRAAKFWVGVWFFAIALAVRYMTDTPPSDERRSRYLRLAAEIKKLAACDARIELRESCLTMVGSWLQLASEIEARQAAASARNGRANGHGNGHGHGNGNGNGNGNGHGHAAFPCPACGSAHGFAGADPQWPDALLGSSCSSCGYKLTAAELHS